ncbi:transglycosylase domain-containing protein [Roseinatronobacter sp. S2]|uniref:transglycosylase domain-containing protein n=1 Tax=Roseinatronobacter sp. S2 TaxID=3035471 RepID=UPI0024102F70|nr:transglycosylase domain-containing protein [Roseinatronobacter sp. S2]WFE75813.1 transglycosylase domain-containing protein [Roseinatronobacter sp. S2]
MKRALKFTATALVVLGVGFTGYGALGYWDAIRQSDKYETRADALIADGRGPDGLGADRLRQLVLVQDPAYLEHSGIDFSTQGAGLTTISQSLSKRLGFDEFRPGIGKIRQTGFALGLESQLSKDQILALWLDTVEMGRGPDGWMTGFFHASESIYGRPIMEISDQAITANCHRPGDALHGPNAAASPARVTIAGNIRLKRSRAAILRAVTRMIGETPLAGISITGLVREAGITRPSFCQHFPDVVAVARAATLDRLAIAFPLPEPLPPGARLTRQKLFGHLSRSAGPIFIHLEAHRAFYVRVMSEAGTADFFNELIGLVGARILPEVINASASTPERRGLTTQFFAGGLVWLAIDWLRGHSSDSAADIARQVAELAADLACGPDGYLR